MVGGYRCVECGFEATELYRDYKHGVIKLAICERCRNPVDKYIEYDPVIIFIDTLLCKAPAYRHVIFNTRIDVHWKVSVFCLLCKAYTYWTQLKQPLAVGEAPPGGPAAIVRSAMEWDFYCLCAASTLELLSFLGAMWCVLLLWKVLCDHATLLRALLLSNYGELMLVPAIIWEHEHAPFCLPLIRLFALASNAQALHVVLDCTWSLACSTVLVGFLAEGAVVSVLRPLG
ncbi:protein ARV1 [Petromyzon marinus]|uniref:Protein ARV n=1 Tax=Petromyzon marinus TaxID=7757 RepID=A0AAJ7STN0_PETMA|nr:protein ARV1 [Petromyzon marinus]